MNHFAPVARTLAEERIMEEERTIELSSASAEAVFALMENPPEPNEYLKNAMLRREEILCRK